MILRAAVAQDGDDGVPRPELPGYPHRRRDVDARGASEQQAFLAQQPIDEMHRLGIGDAQRIVDRRPFEVGRHAARADALGDRRAAVGFQLTVLHVMIERATRRIDQHDADPRRTST